MQQSYNAQGDHRGPPRLSEARNIVKTIGVAPAILAAGTLMETIERNPTGGAVVFSAYLAWLAYSIGMARVSRTQG